MLILYDYICPEHGPFESLEASGTTVASCPGCNQPSPRQLTMPHLSYTKMGVDPDMTTAADKWARWHEDKAQSESQQWDASDNQCRNLEF